MVGTPDIDISHDFQQQISCKWTGVRVMLVYDLYIPLLFLDFNFDAHNVCAIECLGFDKSKIKHEVDLEFW